MAKTLITHHNKQFRGEFITLNDNAFVGCTFQDYTLNVVNNPQSTIIITHCQFDPDCELAGDGWPYELAELWKENLGSGRSLNWEGEIGNKKPTLH